MQRDQNQDSTGPESTQHRHRVRIAQAKSAFAELSKILTNKGYRSRPKKGYRLLCHPNRDIRGEAWTVNKNTVNTMNTAEMWCSRRMLRIFYMDRVTNEEVLRRAREKSSICRSIAKKQATAFERVTRRHKLEHLVTTGKIDGRRSKGRLREKVTDCLS